MKKFVDKIKKNIKLLVIHMFNLLPIKNNKIFLLSYYGSQYGCSPKYISEYLVDNYPKGKFDIVWAFNDINSNKNIRGIRRVKIMSLKYFYEICTSKVIITNFRTTDLFVKRNNQYYIQTWHSSLRLKQIEKDVEETLEPSYIEMAKKDSKKCDLLLSGCKFSTEIFKRAFWYNGEILECGTPRNDIFFGKSLIHNEIKNKIGIDEGKKVILYAPTFRKNEGLEVYNIDYKKVIEAAQKRFSGDWVVLIKLHPHLMAESFKLVYGEDVIDVTKYDDIQELLSISDILISDYSSLMFDFAITNKPCFLYTPDLDRYISKDRGLYFDIEKLPFVVAKDNVELYRGIMNFDEEVYKNRISDFSRKIGSFENGTACRVLANRLEDICFSVKGEFIDEKI